MRNRIKKCGAWILAFVMIFSLSGSAVWAVNDETDLSQEADTYVKPAASVLSKPSQDSDGYYILTTESELLWIADQVNNQKNTGLNAKLGNDLDLSAVCYEGADWEPIGTDSYPYSGIFDGCGYTISGLYGNLSGYTAGYGLFGTTSAATIRNLTVSGEITGDSSSYVGGIAGVSDQNTSFENCTNCVTIQISSGSYAFGGIVAELFEGTVTGCSNEADISGAQHTGGIVGYASGAEISGCSNSGSVTGSSYNTGGIAGYAVDAAAITDSENSGSVTGTSFVGGIAGFCAGTSTADIAYCYNTATISGSNYVGGLAGTAGRNGTVTNSYNVGTVDCSGTCGGVAGTLTAGSEANISNTYYKSSCAAGGVAGEDTDGTVSVKSMQTAGGELAYLLNTNDTAGDYRWVQDEDSLIPVLSDEGVDQLPYQVAMYYQQSGSDPVFYGNVYTQSDGTILLPGPNIDYFAVEGYYVMKNGTVTGTAFSANTAVTADMAVCAVLTYSEGTVYEDEDSYQGQSSDADTDRSYDDYETDVTDFEAWTDHYGEWVTQSDGSAIDTMVIYANLYFDEPVRLADNMSVDDLKEELSVQVGSWSVESSKDFDVGISADGCELSFTIYIGYALYGGHLVIWPENEDAGLSSLVFEDSGQAVDVKADLVVPNGLYTEITSVTVGTADTPASTTVKLIARNEDNDHTTRGMIHMAMLSNGESALGTINVYGGNLTGHWHDYQNLTAEEYWTLGYIDEDKLAEYGYTASFDGDEMTITANEAKEGEVLEFHIVSYLNNGTVETDRTALNRIIAAAEKVTDGGSADDDAWETFVTKLALAEAAQESSYYSQDDIDTKTEELILAYEALGYAYSDGDTLAIRRGNIYYFQDTLEEETSTNSVVYGRSADEVLVGDWDGDGVDTLCVRRGNVYYFLNDQNLESATADYVLTYGRSADEVLVGDWDGDGVDTICVRRGNVYCFTNDPTLQTETADVVLTFGKESDEVLVGDWDGDGIDTLMLRRSNKNYVCNDMETLQIAQTFTYGRSGDTILAGDWNGDGADTLAVRRGNYYYFNYELKSGTEDLMVKYGRETDEVFAGRWK